jgi:hypothetical protein
LIRVVMGRGAISSSNFGYCHFSLHLFGRHFHLDSLSVQIAGANRNIFLLPIYIFSTKPYDGENPLLRLAEPWLRSFLNRRPLFCWRTLIAETRFELRTARGRGRVARGLAVPDKAPGKRAQWKRS